MLFRSPKPTPPAPAPPPAAIPVPKPEVSAPPANLPPHMTKVQTLELENVSMHLAMIIQQVQGQVRPLIDQRSALIDEVLKDNPGWQWDQNGERFIAPAAAPAVTAPPDKK